MTAIAWAEVAEVAEVPALRRLGPQVKQVKCVLSCANYGGSHCARCRIPDAKGAPICPECGRRLYYLDATRDEQGSASLWACDGKRGCPSPTIRVPLEKSASQAEEEQSAEAELAQYKAARARRLQVDRQRKRRGKQRSAMAETAASR
jgi:hypothetical protein